MRGNVFQCTHAAFSQKRQQSAEFLVLACVLFRLSVLGVRRRTSSGVPLITERKAADQKAESRWSQNAFRLQGSRHIFSMQYYQWDLKSNVQAKIQRDWQMHRQRIMHAQPRDTRHRRFAREPRARPSFTASPLQRTQAIEPHPTHTSFAHTRHEIIEAYSIQFDIDLCQLAGNDVDGHKLVQIASHYVFVCFVMSLLCQFGVNLHLSVPLHAKLKRVHVKLDRAYDN
jgi:hypothetical protein